MNSYRVTDSISRTTIQATNMFDALNKAHEMLRGNVVVELFGGEEFVAESPVEPIPWKVGKEDFEIAWKGAKDLPFTS